MKLVLSSLLSISLLILEGVLYALFLRTFSLFPMSTWTILEDYPCMLQLVGYSLWNLLRFFVPKAIKEDVEKLFDIHRAMDHSELVHNLVALDVGEEFNFRKDLKVRAFKTHHVIPSQGYLIYSVKHKLKEEYKLLSKYQIRDLKLSGLEVTNPIASPEVAFTGDTMADFIVDPDNADVLSAKILVMECTFLDNKVSVEHAREYGHTHLAEEIEEAISKLPAPFTGRVFALTEGF